LLAGPVTSTRQIAFNSVGGVNTNGNDATFGNISGGTTFSFNKYGAGNLGVNRVRTLATGGMNVAAGKVTIASARSTTNTSVVGSLTIAGGTDAWTSTLDLNQNDLIVDYTGGSPIGTIQNQIKSGYAGGSWNGNGINSSAAAAAGATSTRTALGYSEASAINAASFSGQTLPDNTAVLVRYTLAGDSDLSGVVDLTDFTFLAANFNTVGTANWLQGDYNYDGNVDLTDFTFLAANFNKSMPADSGGGGSLGALVPEPTALGIALCAAAPSITGRRRRRR
jgi:hypothetical protein